MARRLPEAWKTRGRPSGRSLLPQGEDIVKLSQAGIIVRGPDEYNFPRPSAGEISFETKGINNLPQDQFYNKPHGG